MSDSMLRFIEESCHAMGIALVVTIGQLRSEVAERANVSPARVAIEDHGRGAVTARVCWPWWRSWWPGWEKRRDAALDAVERDLVRLVPTGTHVRVTHD